MDINLRDLILKLIKSKVREKGEGREELEVFQ
jgi:hypothetical protein